MKRDFNLQEVHHVPSIFLEPDEPLLYIIQSNKVVVEETTNNK